MAKALLSAAFLVLLVLIACSDPVPTEIPTRAPELTATAAPTSTTIPTPAPTATPVPTPTQMTAATPEPVATATPTPPLSLLSLRPPPRQRRGPERLQPLHQRPRSPLQFGAGSPSHPSTGAHPTTRTTIATRRRLNLASSRPRAASTGPTREHGLKALRKQTSSTSSPAPRPTTAGSVRRTRQPGPSSHPTS